MKTKTELFAVGLLLAAVANGFCQPAVTCQPQNQINIAGTTAMFSVCATGMAPLTYQWRSHASASSFTNIPWGMEATLLLTNVQPTIRRFSIVVRDAGGLSATSSPLVSLTVLVPPSITNEPTSRTVGRCATVAFTVGAAGTLPLSYQWRFNDVNLLGKTNAVLNLSNIQDTNAGDYTVVITNVAGSITSELATLTVDPNLIGYSGVYVFGHSWSDTKITSHACTLSGAASNYWQGRYCNGPMWPEFLSTNLALDYSAANNYAVCGATTVDVLNQVIAFPPPLNPELGLFFIWSGAVFVTDNLFDDTVWNARILSWVNDITNTVLRLYAKGARAIVVQNWHDLSQSPANIQTLGSNTPSQLQFRHRVISLNAALSSAMENLNHSKPDLRLHSVDNFSRLNATLADPAAFGLTKSFPDAVSDPALADKSLSGPGADYVFWDPRHPTSKVQRLISDWTLEVLASAAPERLRLKRNAAALDFAMQKLKVCREYKLQRSTNLADWQDATSFIASAGTNQLSLPLPAESATFYRLQWGR